MIDEKVVEGLANWECTKDNDLCTSPLGTISNLAGVWTFIPYAQVALMQSTEEDLSARNEVMREGLILLKRLNSGWYN